MDNTVKYMIACFAIAGILIYLKNRKDRKPRKPMATPIPTQEELDARKSLGERFSSWLASIGGKRP